MRLIDPSLQSTNLETTILPPIPVGADLDPYSWIAKRYEDLDLL